MTNPTGAARMIVEAERRAVKVVVNFIVSRIRCFVKSVVEEDQRKTVRFLVGKEDKGDSGGNGRGFLYLLLSLELQPGGCLQATPDPGYKYGS